MDHHGTFLTSKPVYPMTYLPIYFLITLPIPNLSCLSRQHQRTTKYFISISLTVQALRHPPVSPSTVRGKITAISGKFQCNTIKITSIPTPRLLLFNWGQTADPLIYSISRQLHPIQMTDRPTQATFPSLKDRRILPNTHIQPVKAVRIRISIPNFPAPSKSGVRQVQPIHRQQHRRTLRSQRVRLSLLQPALLLQRQP